MFTDPFDLLCFLGNGVYARIADGVYRSPFVVGDQRNLTYSIAANLKRHNLERISAENGRLSHVSDVGTVAQELRFLLVLSSMFTSVHQEPADVPVAVIAVTTASWLWSRR